MKQMTLGTRVSLSAAIVLAVGLTVLSLTLISTQRGQVIEEAIHSSDNVAEMILLSISHEMLADNPKGVQEILQSVGSHPGVDRIRLFNKEGEISHSSDSDEVGTMVDKNAEACFLCHDANKPIRHLPIADRSRVY